MDPLERSVCQITGAKRATRTERIQSLWSGYGELVKMDLDGVEHSQVVVKHAKPPERQRARGNARDSEASHARKLRSYGVEKHWYERYALRCDASCRVPKSLGCRNQGGDWIFVLEDLDAAGYLRRVSLANHEEVAAVIDWLAAFHATFFDQPAEELWSVGSYWHLATRREELSRVRDPLLRAAAPKLDAALNACKARTLIHGDAKVENFCFTPVGKRSSGSAPKVAAVDFQYVGGGCGMKDVAYFFSSVWESRDCDAYAEDALGLYFEALRRAFAERRPNIAFAPIEREWRTLYPVAWADFQRFLAGWAPGQYDEHPYAQRMLHQATSAL